MTSEPRPADLDRGRPDPRIVEALRILGRTGRMIARFTLNHAAAYGHSLWATPIQAVDPEAPAADHPEPMPTGSPLSEDEIMWQLELRLDAADDAGPPPDRTDSTAWWLFWL